MGLLAKLKQLKLNVHINLVVYGREPSVNLYLGRLPCSALNRLNCLSLTEPFKQHQIQCCLWQAHPQTTNQRRYFFQRQVDQCILVINAKTETGVQLYQLVNSLISLCPNTPILVQVMQGEGNSANLAQLLEVVLDQKSQGVNIDFIDSQEVHATLQRLIGEHMTARQDKLNQQAQRLISKRSQ